MGKCRDFITRPACLSTCYWARDWPPRFHTLPLSSSPTGPQPEEISWKWKRKKTRPYWKKFRLISALVIQKRKKERRNRRELGHNLTPGQVIIHERLWGGEGNYLGGSLHTAHQHSGLFVKGALWLLPVVGATSPFNPSAAGPRVAPSDEL